MASFFEAFKIVEEDGTWTSGYTVDSLDSGITTKVVDICAPEKVDVPAENHLGWRVYPFAVLGHQVVPTRCTPNQIQSIMAPAIQQSTEYTVTDVLWNGSGHPENEMFLTHSSVATVPPGGSPAESLGTLLSEAYERTPYLQPLIHLGFTAAVNLQFGLNTLGIPYVIGPAYPPNTIAVTGPVTVRLSSIRTTSQVDPDLNRRYVEGDRVGAIELDPTKAIRVATP